MLRAAYGFACSEPRTAWTRRGTVVGPLGPVIPKDVRVPPRDIWISDRVADFTSLLTGSDSSRARLLGRVQNGYGNTTVPSRHGKRRDR